MEVGKVTIAQVGTPWGSALKSDDGDTEATTDSQVNVVDFGADPSGVRDSTAALTAAHATGKLVYYPKGKFRFNGPTLRLSGGVKRASPAAVTVFCNISDENVLQFDLQDGSGPLIGLQHNHMEWNEANHYTAIPAGAQGAPMDVGAIVSPPLSKANRTVTRERSGKSVVAFWYNDVRLHLKAVSSHTTLCYN